MALHLGLRFEPPVSPWPLAGDLDTLVSRLALGATGLPRRRVRLEQLELAAVVHHTNSERAPGWPAPTCRALSVEGAEARVVELARGRMQVAGMPADCSDAPTQVAARAFDLYPGGDLDVVRPAPQCQSRAPGPRP